EVGWLINPCFSQRMIRTLYDKGECVSLTLVSENKK
ncbi:MAG: hypothetical protein AAFW70_31010, partial [Cyanobacteria bacterium J06635_10]